LLSGIAERQSHVADAASQGLIGHNDAGPDRFNKLVLSHQTASVLGKIAQYSEALWPELDFAVPLAEAAAPEVESKSIKAKDLGIGRLHHYPHVPSRAAWQQFQHILRLFAYCFQDWPQQS
jgi:hypothetical protein